MGWVDSEGMPEIVVGDWFLGHGAQPRNLLNENPQVGMDLDEEADKADRS